MTNSCPTVTQGQHLTASQKVGLEWVAGLHGGRDVVLAIDLTESVGLNDEGRIRLRQIVEDSLKPGDSVYVVPFASSVNPLSPTINPLTVENAITYKGKKEDIDRVVQRVPVQPNLALRQTDIQAAELNIYQNLAQINQCRLAKNQPIKPQSVVWITDAPLFTQAGISSQVWIETPANSPFRVANSLESQDREKWLKALPIKQRSLAIKNKDNKDYKLTVVDISASVQEFCTPAPGGRETCLVTSYILKQLWLPSVIAASFFLALIIGGIKLYQRQKKWKLIIDFSATNQQEEEQICYLGNNQKISIGQDDSNYVDSIDCPGSEVRAYLVRQGEKLYLEPTEALPISLNGKKVKKRTPIVSNGMRLNCPDGKNGDWEISISIKK